MKKQMLVATNITHEPYFKRCLNHYFVENAIEWEVKYLDIFTGERRKEKYDLILIWIDLENLLVHFENVMDSNARKEEMISTIFEYCTYSVKQFLEEKNIIYISFENFYDKKYYVVGNTHIGSLLIDELNIRMCELFVKATIIDLRQVIARIGTNNAYSEKNKYRWNSPYSRELYLELSNDIYKQYLAQNEVKYKCIVLDCDNVLWGGTLSESPLGGIQLGDIGEGRRYKDFQRFLCFLYKSGILLAILSKNDMDDVLDVFKYHSDMVLKIEYISCFEVSWEPKSEGIRKISEFLKISMDSMIFIDDSEFEIQQVKMQYPSVTTFLFESENIYQKLGILNVKGKEKSNQADIRNGTYRDNIKRKELEQNCKSYEEYLERVHTEVEIIVANKMDWERISELSLRANRYTNGKRYSFNDICSLELSYRLYAVYAKDMFGDMGLVGAIGVYKNQLCLFCLSCRALGRNIEKMMLKYIIEHENIYECYFMATSKNKKMKELLREINNNIIFTCQGE